MTNGRADIRRGQFFSRQDGVLRAGGFVTTARYQQIARFNDDKVISMVLYLCSEVKSFDGVPTSIITYVHETIIIFLD
jgi:hypothetical protein